MRKANIIFQNLRAEMARKNISVQDVAQCWGCNRDTAARKLSGKTALMLNEAFSMQTAFFPEQSVKYLFSEATTGSPTTNNDLTA